MPLPGGMMGRDFCRAASPLVARPEKIKRERQTARIGGKRVTRKAERTNRTRNIPRAIIERNVSMMNGNSKGVSIIIYALCFLE